MAERLLALTALAGRMVVVAAATDEWGTARRGFARLMGRGDAEQTRLTERQLEETREQLTRAAGPSAGQIRTTLAALWAGRLAELLEENPDAEAELQALVREIQAVPHAEMRPASSHAASAYGVASTNAAAEPAPKHPDTLTNRHNLANFTGYAGDAAAARDQFAALLPVRERVSGRDHPDTLAAKFSLAYWTGRAGDAAAARDQFAALLPIRERVSGRDHPDTLAAREELAYWTGCAGDAAARNLSAAPPLVRQWVPGPAESARPAMISQATKLIRMMRWGSIRGNPGAATATVIVVVWVVVAVSVTLLTFANSHPARALVARPSASTPQGSSAVPVTTTAVPRTSHASPSPRPSPTVSQPPTVLPPPVVVPSASPTQVAEPSTSPTPSAGPSKSPSPEPSNSPSPNPSTTPSPSPSTTNSRGSPRGPTP